MIRKLLGVVGALACAAVATAEPPAQRAMVKANVPPRAGDAFVVSNKAVNGMLLPLPGLGFVPLPVEAWRCEVWHTPPGAPAGTPRVRNVVTLFSFGG